MNHHQKAMRKAALQLLSILLAVFLMVGAAPRAMAASSKGLTDFGETETVSVDKTEGIVTVGNTHGDHFVVYEGMEQKANDFVLEADMDLVSGGYDGNKESRCAGLLFGLGSKNTRSRFWQWNCANIDAGRSGEDAFRVFGPGIPDTNHDGNLGDIDLSKTIHLKVDMKASGEFTYTFGNVGGEMRTLTDKINDWKGGYVGVMSFCTEARFSNISFEDRTDHSKDNVPTGPAAVSVALDDNFTTNLTSLTSYGGTWEVRESGLYSNSIDQGNTWAFSTNTGTNFVYSTDVTFLQDQGAATLLFRGANGEGFEDCYAVNLDASSLECKIWRETLVTEGDQRKTESENLNVPQKVDATDNKTYTLTAVANGAWLQFYVNDTLVGSTGDYTLQTPDGQGQNTYLKSGYFGLLNWNGEMVFQNTQYTEITSTFTPLAKDITVTSSTGSVEEKAGFRQLEPTMIQFVGNDASTVDMNVTPVSSSAKVVVTGPDGRTYTDGKNIPVAVGKNFVTITITDTNADGTEAYATYRVDVHRRQADEIYYNEPYRGQYHYSIKDGWGNDPNGMVYYNGVYHLYHQFDDDPNHEGQVHWIHLTSTDLIHWEEHPVDLYPDSYGAMFSGCAVVDENNTSGLFSGSKGGLVAIITTNGNGQHIEIAHSEDDGMTWIKEDGIAADWSDDPLQVRDFRDPKVFRWENKWFMVLAGGPLRIYSSDNLLDWTCESAYDTLHTECPDLYPIKASDGQLKWVLSRGGRLYKIGDFKQVDGKWSFVPDEQYKDTDGIMNFGKDYYAAMTFYVNDFGTAANPTLPDIIEINWMNTWEYCTQVAREIGKQSGTPQEFNGTYNLTAKVGIEAQDGGYVLTQAPIEQYETLRDTANAVTLTDAGVTADMLKDIQSDCYELIASFTPDADTKKVGFSLRKGGSEETLVVYDLEKEELSIDRSNSGIIINDAFKAVVSQKMEKSADGKVELHIYVDRASVEVFNENASVCGAMQIFPSADSLGIEVVAEGGAAKADITVYPMNSIWHETEAETPATAPEEPAAPDMNANEIVTRSMAVEVLCQRENGEGDAIAWAVAQGLITGYPDGSYKPNAAITRQELAVVLCRYAAMKGMDTAKTADLTAFADSAEVSDWAADMVRWAVGAGVFSSEGRIVPEGTVTYRELTEMLAVLD